MVSFLSFLISKGTLPPSVLLGEGALQRHSTSLKLTRLLLEAAVEDKPEPEGCRAKGTTSTNSCRLHPECHPLRRTWLKKAQKLNSTDKQGGAHKSSNSQER